jgi:integrase
VTLLDHVERSSSADEEPKRILAGDELRRLLAAIDPDHRLIFETAAETGAPLAETLGIVWREVDLDAETITFSHQHDSHGARIPLKTKRSPAHHRGHTVADRQAARARRPVVRTTSCS